MINEIINDYKSKIDTQEEMVFVLSKYRDNLMNEYSTKIGWRDDDALPLLDMILRLDEAIRRYNFSIQLKKEKKEML